MGNLADMQSALVDYIDMVGMSGYAQKEASGTILGSFSSMKAAASDFMTALVSSNGDVEGSFETLKETAFTFFDNIKPKILEFLKSISPIAATVAGITGAFVSFKAAASISSLLSVLINSWQTFKLANEGATIAQWALNAAMNANPIVLIVTLIGGLVAALVTLWHTNDDFKQSVIDAWEEIKEVFSKVGDFSKETFEKIGQFFENTLNETTEFFSNIWQGVTNFFSNTWNNITSFFVGIWEDITGFFSTMWAGIQEFLDRPGYYIGYAIGWIFNQIKEFFTVTIPNAWNAFTTWLLNGLSAIGENIKTFFTQTIPNTWNNFKTWISNKFNELKENVKTFFTETIPNAWSGLKDKAREIMENVTKIITDFFTVTIPNKWESFKKNAMSKINSIKDWFKNLPSSMTSIGRNIVEGLWNGLKARWTKLKNDAKGLLDSFISGFKKGLGIASPSKLFKLFGEYIDEGLSIGLLDNADSPISAIESVSDQLVSAFDPDLATEYMTTYDGYGSSAYGGSSSAYSSEEASSSVNITFGEKAFYIANFNGNSESEVDNFVDAVIDKLSSKIQSKEAVFA